MPELNQNVESSKLAVIETKDTIIGLVLLLSSAIIYAATLILSAIYFQNFAGTDGQIWKV